MSLIVKICGLSTPATLDVALEAGADMVGFVFFPPSPRHLDLAQARELGARVRGRAGKVALTVDADDATLGNIVETLRPDLLQLHGKESVARIRDIKQTFGLPVMKAVGVREFARHLAGEIGLDQAIAEARQATRNYAKRQLTWFRADPRIHWLVRGEEGPEAERALVERAGGLLQRWARERA